MTINPFRMKYNVSRLRQPANAKASERQDEDSEKALSERRPSVAPWCAAAEPAWPGPPSAGKGDSTGLRPEYAASQG
jgi:hypothetical protein